MSKDSIEVYKYVSRGFFVTIIGLGIVIFFVTYTHPPMTNANPLIFWTFENHLSITIALVIISGLIGYLSSTLTYNQITKTKKESKKLIEMLFLFLNKDEKEIMNHLVKNNGSTNQAEISRLQGMNRVKSFRSLKKMQEKNLIDIKSHGKIRKISLKENILKILSEE